MHSSPKLTCRARSENIQWESGALTLEQREELNGHKAAILWFTGLSGSGKSTIAKSLEENLFRVHKTHTMFLDGDNLRHGLNGDLGFSSNDRQENIRRTAEVARLGATHGQVVLCSFISPYIRDRDFARSLAPEERFFEIYVKCDIEELKRRDTKGLYAKAIMGEIKSFTGISAPYEEPEEPEMIVRSDQQSIGEIVELIIEMLKAKKVI
mmetsp:Transcript_10003/g.15376  ORF Transcript_10003/g.15376 Transcript_10003/m.15376 type:complete len:210 (+) Transcript_10003:158-787(+)